MRKKLKTLYGLPDEIKFCKKCVMSNQRPASTQEFKHKPDSKKVTMNFDFASVSTTSTIKKGDKFSEENIFPIRPSNGSFKIKDYHKLIGKVAKRDLKKGIQLKLKDVY